MDFEKGRNIFEDVKMMNNGEKKQKYFWIVEFKCMFALKNSQFHGMNPWGYLQGELWYYTH